MITTATLAEITDLVNLAIRSKNTIRHTTTVAEADALAETAHAAMEKAHELAGPDPVPRIVRERLIYGGRVTCKAWQAARDRAAKAN